VNGHGTEHKAASPNKLDKSPEWNASNDDSNTIADKFPDLENDNASTESLAEAAAPSRKRLREEDEDVKEEEETPDVGGGGDGPSTARLGILADLKDDKSDVEQVDSSSASDSSSEASAKRLRTE
jgi:hypothetical protein